MALKRRRKGGGVKDQPDEYTSLTPDPGRPYACRDAFPAALRPLPRKAWMGARIAGVGKALPKRVLTNGDLERMVATSDEWITERTGIRERHVAAPDETASTLAIRAAQEALACAHLAPTDLDMIILGTVTGDYSFPATACLVQDALGARVEIAENQINIESNKMNLVGIKNSLRPTLNAFAELTNNGLTGTQTALAATPATS